MLISPIIAALFLPAPLTAQPAPAEAPVKLELQCSAPCTFRQGEPIWLDLNYSASAPGYSVLIDHADRNYGNDEFLVTPSEDTSDPVAPYPPLVQPKGGTQLSGQRHFPIAPLRFEWT